MENCITSTPLYERIIVDRTQNKVFGFTFENLDDKQYQETYCYQKDPMNASQTIYNAYLYKPPGYRKWIRQKAHHWGVSTLEGIMDKERQIAEELKKKGNQAKDFAVHKKEQLKEKIKRDHSEQK